MLFPKSSATRTVTTLNEIWKFKEENHTVDPHLPLQDWQPIAVPASFNDQIMDPLIKNKIGYFWYETTLNITQQQLGQRLVLHFEGVSQNAQVFINGDEIGNHIGGFTPFEFVINRFVHVGANDLKVRVNNLLDATTLPSSDLYAKAHHEFELKTRFDFFNYAGINRPVKLYTTNSTYIEHIAVNYQLTSDQAQLNPDITIDGPFDSVLYKVLDQDDRVVAKGSNLPLSVKHPIRWQPGKGYVYQLEVNVYDHNSTLLDSYQQEFGLRTIEIKNNQFFINNQPFYFTGFGRHEDTIAHGKGINLPQTVQDFNIMKKMGANSLRTSHYPYSYEAIQQANREGIVVIEEVPAVGLFKDFHVNLQGGQKDGKTWRQLDTLKNHKQALKEMIDRDHDCPAIVMWSVANEPASHESGAHSYFKQIVDYTHQIDPQKRPLTVANIFMASADNDQIGDLLDVISLNRYFGWYIDFNDFAKAKNDLSQELTKWHKRYPDKPIMFTEVGADTIDGTHSIEHEPYSEEYQIDFYQNFFDTIDPLNYVIGEQLWAFADFATSPTMLRINGQNDKGIFTRDRRPKAIAGFLKHRWLNM